MGVREDARRGGIDLTPWGKFDRGAWAVYPLLFHLLDVAALAGVVWDRYLTRGQRRLIAAGLGLTLAEARCLVMFIAGLHDLGKLSAFQEQEAYPWARVSDSLRADTRGWQRMPHERASMHSVLHLLAETGYPADTSDSPGVLVAQILGGHHGRFLQVDIDGAARASRVNLTLGGPAWQDLRRRYFALLRHLTGATALPADVSVPAAVLIAGIGIIADRLASQRHCWLPKAQAPAFGAGEHYAQAVRDAPAVVEESGLTRITLPQVPFAQAHGGLERPNALQASVIGQLTAAVGEKGPGILVVTDATGGGKSVTALEAARIFNASGDTAGILWLLPTTATTDAAYGLLEAYVAAHQPEHAPVSLVHSHSYDNTAYTDHRLATHEPSTSDAYWPDSDDGDDNGGELAARERHENRVTVPDGWLRGWDRSLLAQFTVATHDQALMAVLPVRFSALRMLAICGRTVIIDEVHALPPASCGRRCPGCCTGWAPWAAPWCCCPRPCPATSADSSYAAISTAPATRAPQRPTWTAGLPIPAGSTPPPQMPPSSASPRPRPKPTPTGTGAAPTSVSTRCTTPPAPTPRTPLPGKPAWSASPRRSPPSLDQVAARPCTAPPWPTPRPPTHTCATAWTGRTAVPASS
ncbi:hypothetical protein SSP24_74770 [Streptomyces spinoverrucosus]|uniref:HD Cas3-type domain-containing protein n=1 Tax=Streptomyces spinoverrucosus TaxID=284043 RepID=A0A4Y3VS23_9ACTN|nr:CRISPR-associated endonuclease Cas3'' [Streptomyces spinoverrucosus]GEC09822.1 hypothetical protein SSP24_74770 [Streptomyces spinoverrucosus]GHB96991.1 hypothetical protein GCM10010397_81960 [Streptomyces spinoverrucosus]